MRKITWRWNGQEVHHPLAKAGVAMAIVIMMPLIIVTMPITILLHFALKAMGRQGFVRHLENNKIQFILDGSGFQKA